MPLMKSEPQISQNSPSAPKAFFLASRPKTWIASLSPVAIGGALALEIQPLILILTFCFSLLIQVGTNFANDYFDFVKGADNSSRKGPKRATQEGWVTPRAMLRASLIAFGLAFLIALPLMIQAGFWSFCLALGCIALGILYTGGPKPLGYLGLGELLVFSFFGPIATCGTYFLQMGQVPLFVFIASLAPGFFSCAILTANNLRDEESDRAAKKMTLIARFGRKIGSVEYALFVLIASLVPLLLVFILNLPFATLLPSVVLIFALHPIRTAFIFKDPLELLLVLQQSAFLLLLYTLLFCMAVW